MGITLSSMLPLGTIAPNFTLFDTTTGKFLSLSDLRSPHGTVIMFICNHCPFVKYARPELLKLAEDYQKKGVSFIAISANDPLAYPDDSPKNMAKVAKSLKFPFPYLFDESQEVAKAYQATCTPDFFIFDGDLQCVYRGQLDDSRPGVDQDAPTGKDLRVALDCLLEGKPIASEQKPSVGCNIKWR